MKIYALFFSNNLAHVMSAESPQEAEKVPLQYRTSALYSPGKPLNLSGTMDVPPVVQEELYKRFAELYNEEPGFVFSRIAAWGCVEMPSS